MCDTDLDLDLEFAEDEEVAGEPAIDARYAGVAWGLAGTDAGTDVEATRSS
jgi:hypothetical protein